MNKKNFFKSIWAFAFIAIFCIPISTKALNVSVDSSLSNMYVGETYLVKVFIDTEGKEINSLEGTLQINGLVNISEVNTGGSVFNLWPEKPRLINKQEISFTGGTEGGIYGKNLRLLNFSITPTIIGKATLNFKGMNAYLNDGLGTKLVNADKSFAIKISQQTEGVLKNNNSVLKDETMPSDFTIELGHDEFLFNGKYFITFNATDALSGVNKYQVKEGSSPYLDSENTYVLKDQTLKSKILVKAIDNAGNERVETLNLKQMLTSFQILRDILIALLIFTIVNILRKFIKRKK